MSKETEKEIAALLAQCESALVEHSNRTGASVFAEALNEPAPKATAITKAVSDKALAKMAKALESSSFDSSEHIAKLDAKLSAKADALEDLKRQRVVLEQELEQARQVDLVNKRKSLYRESPGTDPITPKEKVVPGRVALNSRRRR